jgi:FtsZ-interacting cell division protein YlmF
MGFLDPVRSFGKTIWGHGDDEDYADERDDNATDSGDESYSNDYSGSYASSGQNGASSYSSDRTTPSASAYSPTTGGKGGGYGSAGAVRRLHAVSPTLRAREKNIYTIKPKRLDEATVAADCLKTGSAVIVNLEAVDRVTAIRIVDFMSGVCYGIDGVDGQPGHCMKLGEMIFLFTPSEFEITSDETDYAANRETFFREVSEAVAASQSAAAQSAVSQSATPIAPAPSSPTAPSSYASSYTARADYSNSNERRAWE